MAIQMLEMVSVYLILPIAALLIIARLLKIKGSPFRFVVLVSTVIGILIFWIYGLPKLTE